MSRSLGLFLVVFGAVSVAVAALWLILGRIDGGIGLLIVPLMLLGFPSLFIGLYFLARENQGGAAPKVVDGRAGNYLADVCEPRQHEGQAYEVMYQTPVRGKNGRPSSLVVGVPAETPTTLHFNAENWFDRMCKRVGIAREHQTGDPEFDDAIYIRGPSHAYAEAYLDARDKRAAILELRQQGFKEIRLTGTKAEAVWPRFDPANHDREGLRESAAGMLFVLANDLPRDDSDPAYRSPEGQFNWYVFLWVLVAGFAAMILFVFRYPPLREGDLVLAALATYAVVLPLFGWVAAYLLRGTSTSHDRWAVLMAAGLFLIGFGSFGAVAGLNGMADDAPPEERSPVVADKHIVKERRSTRFYAVVTAWDRPEKLDIRVSHAEYEKIVPGESHLDLTIGRGRFGILWLKAKHLRP